MKISLSELDTNRFGKRIAKISVDDSMDIDSINDACMTLELNMLIIRCPTSNISSIQKLEKSGYFLTDTLVYFQNKKINASPIQLPVGFTWRTANKGDAEAVSALAGKCFSDFAGHYHTDPYLDRKDADLVYTSWAFNSCHSGSFSDQVFLICQENNIVGFLSTKKIDAENGEIILNGVDPACQKNGFYAELVAMAKNWALDENLQNLSVSTQISNIAPQKVWCRHGFEPLTSFHTFHKWFNQ
ncbi:GNAT family N-acetyltransferase [Janthinobacterium tructae]|uniref:GNAT family N-acetyltransferase n=1 Tax=Janthinobacterium tructae TaxID=2590869 RepID=A0A4Y6RED4_9BURK|nr:GNAT family N-acetyltransferase [Janthinobacterium tructae]QDG71382.1 GNAT family N-acetyltransferase [Janthinobacterium tructae]